MNLDELRTVQSKERQKDSLQHLRPSFYQEVADYISELKEERERVAEAADDPFSSPEVGRLTDEIETAKDVVEAIYERRMGKLVKQASLAAAGMPANDEGLTAEEQDLFEDLISRIESNKGRVLDVLEGSASSSSGTETESESESETTSNTDTSPDSSADRTAVAEGAPSESTPSEADPNTDTDTDTGTPPTPPQAPPGESDVGRTDPETPAREDDAATDSGVSAADVMGGDVPSSKTNASDTAGVQSAADSDSGSNSNSSAEHAVDTDTGTDTDADADPNSDAETDRNVDRVTVRITRDVGSILGVDDREYTLSSDDVVTLPEQNATPLVERDAAESLE
ncbi:hypothetical protein [Halomontanus rarus]|uniref:DNA replication complex subunit Gins51 n=1 Tax=Halomontanus rarus TaxID=3034020 RepID=UPI0023E8F6E3|nr:hypothetical protein [Halovivax sp. TS33]